MASTVVPGSTLGGFGEILIKFWGFFSLTKILGNPHFFVKERKKEKISDNLANRFICQNEILS